MQQESSIFDYLQCQEYIIDEQKITFTKDQQLEKVQNLVSNLKTKYKTYACYSKIEEDEYLITMPLETHNSICTFLFEILLNFKYTESYYKVIYTDFNGKIIIQQKNIRLQLCRYMLRLNSGLRVGSFFLHPQEGYIGLKLQCQSERGNLFYQTESDYDEYINYIDSLIQTALYTVRYHFLRIMILINRIDIKKIDAYEEYMRNNWYQGSEKKEWRKYPQEINTLLQRLKNTIQINLNETFNIEQHQKYGPMISKQITTESKVINQIQVDSPSDLQVGKINEINSGGFSIIYGKDITYKVDRNEKQIILKKHFAIKVDRKKEDQKIQKEIKILQALAQENQQGNQENQIKKNEYFKFTGTCPYIAQFYYVPENTDVLLMERYFYSSLDYFQVRQEEYLSISSKLFMAQCIAMGLRYCHNYDIIHMDIKPANILISKSFIAKISDFGEAISTKGKQQHQKVGRSMPYCAPEMMNPKQEEKFSHAYDIFSFGIVLFELLFERHPIDFRNQNIKILEEKYQKLAYSVRFNKEYDEKRGPQKLMKYLLNLCLACLQPDPKSRPNIDKIVLILKDSLSYLDKMY